MRGRTLYKGDKYRWKESEYNNYIIRYELNEEGIQPYSSIYCYSTEEELKFNGKDLKDCENQILNWFKNLINTNKVIDFIKKGYKIYPSFENVLLDVRDVNVCYHITDTENRNLILEKGLIANGSESREVINASKLIDKVKPKNMENKILRLNSVYAHPIASNELILDYDYRNSDLYAIVNIDIDKCWVGSQGLGGFLLLDEDVENGQDMYEKKDIANAKLYWKNSCSLRDYINKTDDYTKKHNSYGLDEILIPDIVDVKNVELIGSWDNEGDFIPNENFIKYIKEKYKNNFKNILNKYKGGFICQ